MEKNITYPDRVWKYTSLCGACLYKHIDGDIYEDQGCNHGGGKCQIHVKKDGDHWDYAGPANDIAEEHEYHHKVSEYDSYYFETKKEAMVNVYTNRVQRDEDAIRDIHAKIKEKKSQLNSMKLIPIPEHTIQDLDYGDKVYCIDGSFTFEDKVEYKAMGKDGLAYLITECSAMIYPADDRQDHLVVKYWKEDYEGAYLVECIGFYTKQYHADYLKNQEYYNLEKEIDALIKSLEYKEGDLKDMQKGLTEWQNKED